MSLLSENSVKFSYSTMHRHPHPPACTPSLPPSLSFPSPFSLPSSGFPEYVSYPEFRRLYGALMPVGEGDSSMSDKDKAEFILSCAEVEKSIYRLGLSRVFFRAGTLAKLDRQVEESTHDVIVQFQVSHGCFQAQVLPHIYGCTYIFDIV